MGDTSGRNFSQPFPSHQLLAGKPWFFVLRHKSFTVNRP